MTGVRVREGTFEGRDPATFAGIFDAVTFHEAQLAEVVGPNEAKRLCQPLYDFAWSLDATPAEPAALDDMAIERMARDHFEPYRHFYEGDHPGSCSLCGEGQDQDFLRVPVHFNDGDG